MHLKYIFFILMFLCPVGYTISAQQASNDTAIIRMQAIKNDTDRSNAYFNFIDKYEEAQPAKALEVGYMALAEAKKINDTLNVARGYYALSNLYYNAGNFPAALQNAIASLHAWQALSNYSGEVKCNQIMTSIYIQSKDYESAKKYCEQAIDICTAHNLSEQKSQSLNLLGVVYGCMEQPEKGLDIYNQLLKLYTQEGNVQGQMYALNNIGILLQKLKKYDEAVQTLAQAEKIADTMSDPYFKGCVYDNIAQLNYRMGDLDKSEANGLIAVDMALKASDPSLLSDIYPLLKKVYQQKGDYQKALDFADKYITLKDTLFSSERVKVTKDLQTKYETDIKDQQIAAQTQKLTYNYRLNIALLVLAALLFAIAFQIWLSRRKKVHLNKLITKQKQELEQVNKVKDKMFSIVGHDVIKPINSLISFAEILDSGDLQPERLSVYTEELKSSLKYTSGVMINLLNWGRSQMEGYKPILEQFDLYNIAEEVVAGLKSEATRKDTVIDNKIPRNTILYADINMTSIIVRNLVSNAIKFTKNGSITLSVAITDKNVQIYIEDTGIGMSKEKVQLFNTSKDFQPIASTLGTNKEQGTGLGLQLCRTFASLMHGNISVESGNGAGSKFTVILPKNG